MANNRSIQWEHLVSGMTAGVVSTLILHPLDLIKIRFQVNEGTGVALRFTSILYSYLLFIFCIDQHIME